MLHFRSLNVILGMNFTPGGKGPLTMSNATSTEQRVTALLTLILVLGVNFKCFQFSLVSWRFTTGIK